MVAINNGCTSKTSQYNGCTLTGHHDVYHFPLWDGGHLLKKLFGLLFACTVCKKKHIYEHGYTDLANYCK